MHACMYMYCVGPEGPFFLWGEGAHFEVFACMYLSLRHACCWCWHAPTAVWHSQTAVCLQVPFVQAVDFEAIDLGTKPLQIGGIKTYNTSEDEVIFEAPGIWGSNARIRVGIRLKLGPLVFYLPIELQDLQVGCGITCVCCACI